MLHLCHSKSPGALRTERVKMTKDCRSQVPPRASTIQGKVLCILARLALSDMSTTVARPSPDQSNEEVSDA